MSATETVERAAADREPIPRILEGLGMGERFSYSADDLVIEPPQGLSLDIPSHCGSKCSAVAYLRRMSGQWSRPTMRNLRFHSVDGDPDGVSVEYEGDSPLPGVDATNGTHDGNL